MTTVIFVHGTGVRRPQFDRTFAAVTAGLSDVDSPVTLTECYWGEPFGAKLSQDGRSIPEATDQRGDAEDEVDLWLLLEADPLYELRLLAAETSRGGELAPDAVLPSQSLEPAAATLLDSPDVLAAAAVADLSDTLGDAVTAVMAAAPTQEALANPGADPAELASAVARAMVAEAMLRADEVDGGSRPVIGRRRDDLADGIAAVLQRDTRGVAGRLAKAGLHLAMELGATGVIERKRAAITRAASPMAGDVLLYLARGDAIRGFIAETVESAADDVILLAHSLGGIACVDLLIERPPAGVRALITVGSQAAYLHELGALPKLEPGSSLPDTFPVPWINVYDVRDLLSFVAEPIFGERVRDVRIDSRAPFPRSHSAYFANPALYAVLRSVLKAVRP